MIDKGKDMSVKSAQTVKHSSSIFQIIHYHLDNLSDTPVHSKVNFFLPTTAPAEHNNIRGALADDDRAAFQMRLDGAGDCDTSVEDTLVLSVVRVVVEMGARI